MTHLAQILRDHLPAHRDPEEVTGSRPRGEAGPDRGSKGPIGPLPGKDLRLRRLRPGRDPAHRRIHWLAATTEAVARSATTHCGASTDEGRVSGPEARRESSAMRCNEIRSSWTPSTI